MNRAIRVAVVLVVLAACGSNPPAREAADQRRQLGIIIRVAAVPTVNTSSDFQRSYMSSMYGAVGSVATEVLGTQRGYPVYRVKVSDDLELAVASKDEFSMGDCVEVWYPAAYGTRHYFGLGEAGIARASGCTADDK
jgi:hypothetical protein